MAPHCRTSLVKLLLLLLLHQSTAFLLPPQASVPGEPTGATLRSADPVAPAQVHNEPRLRPQSSARTPAPIRPSPPPSTSTPAPAAPLSPPDAISAAAPSRPHAFTLQPLKENQNDWKQPNSAAEQPAAYRQGLRPHGHRPRPPLVPRPDRRRQRITKPLSVTIPK